MQQLTTKPEYWPPDFHVCDRWVHSVAFYLISVCLVIRLQRNWGTDHTTHTHHCIYYVPLSSLIKPFIPVESVLLDLLQ